MEKADRRIISELDQLVAQQQVHLENFYLLLLHDFFSFQTTLEQAGVPGFYVTTNPQEVQVQMQLLSFIARLSTKRGSPSNI